jgi:hypothetical protein
MGGRSRGRRSIKNVGGLARGWGVAQHAGGSADIYKFTDEFGVVPVRHGGGMRRFCYL